MGDEGVYEDNINIKEILGPYEGVVYVIYVQNWDPWQTVVNTIINIWKFRNVDNFLFC